MKGDGGEDLVEKGLRPRMDAMCAYAEFRGKHVWASDVFSRITSFAGR